MPGELLQFRVQVRIVPIGTDDSRLEIIDHHRGRDSSKMPKRVLQGADEGLRILPPHRFAIAFARAAQHAAQQMRPAPSAVFHDPRPLPEIDLQFLARRTLHAPERQLRDLGPLPANEAPHAVITAHEAVLGHQVLINPLHRQARLHRRLDLLPPRNARAAAHRAGLHPG